MGEPEPREDPWLTARSPWLGWKAVVFWGVPAGWSLVLVGLDSVLSVLPRGVGVVLFLLLFVPGIGWWTIASMAVAFRGTRFRLFDDRVEILTEHRAAAIPYERIRHFELAGSGRLRMRLQGDLDEWPEEFTFVTARLHAEDRFDEWMDRVERANPTGFYSVAQRLRLVQTRPWTLEEVLGDLGQATSATLCNRKVIVGDHELRVQQTVGWTIPTSGGRALRVYGLPTRLMTVEGVGLGMVEGDPMKKRLDLGEHGAFVIHRLHGTVHRDGVEIGSFRFEPRFEVRTREPVPAILLVALVVAAVYPEETDRARAMFVPLPYPGPPDPSQPGRRDSGADRG